MKSFFLWSSFFVIGSLSQRALAQAQASPQELQIKDTRVSSTMGALQKIISEKTKVSTAPESSLVIDPNAEVSFQELNGELENCNTTEKFPAENVRIEKNGLGMDFKTYSLTIDGPNCPFEIHTSMIDQERDLDNLKAQFKLSMKIKEAAFIQKYGMRFVESSGEIHAKAVEKQSRVEVEGGMSIRAKVDSLDLGILDQEESFLFNVFFDMTNFQLGMKMIQRALAKSGQRSDLGIATIEMNGFTEPKSEYILNNKKVSESEFKKFMQSFSLSMDDKKPEEGASPDQRVISNCQYIVYDKKRSHQDINIDLFKKMMAEKSLPSEGIILNSQSCMKNQQKEFSYLGKNYLSQLEFPSQWIQLKSHSNNNQNQSSVYVLYGDTEVQASDSGSLLFGLKCEPSQCQ